MTPHRYGLQFLELRKPEGIGLEKGIGLESWRRMKKLLKQHPALALGGPTGSPGQAGGGVLVISKSGKLSVHNTGSSHGDQVQSYDQQL